MKSFRANRMEFHDMCRLPAALILVCFFLPGCDPSAEVEAPRALSPKPVPVPPARNLISSTFAELDKEGLPVGWKITKHGENSHLVDVTVEQDKTTGQNAVKINIPIEACVYVDTIHPADLDPKKEYLLVVPFKVENMYYLGSWHRRPACIRFFAFAYGTGGKRHDTSVYGVGNTQGWVTAVMPFLVDADKKDAEYYSRTDVFLRCYNIAGTVWFRDPMIVEKPEGVEPAIYYEHEDGTQAFGKYFPLTK